MIFKYGEWGKRIDDQADLRPMLSPMGAKEGDGAVLSEVLPDTTRMN
jgi:hypothetical protein